MIVAVIAQTDDVHLRQMALILQQRFVIIYWQNEWRMFIQHTLSWIVLDWYLV